MGLVSTTWLNLSLDVENQEGGNRLQLAEMLYHTPPEQRIYSRPLRIAEHKQVRSQ